jgi:hypothetical protein
MKRDETEANRRWVEQWRTAGPLLEQIRIEELRAMTDEEARKIAECLLEAAPMANDWSPNPSSSGLIEQQRIFRSGRRP